MSPSMNAPKCDVFISYARADYKDENNKLIPDNVISKITSAFQKNNISYWIDENGIYTGDNFAPKIAAAIQNASVFVFVSTKNSNSSRWVQREIAVANDFNKPILPVKCDESTYAVAVIMYLAMLDYCDYRNSPETAINKLVESVKDKLPLTQTQSENNRAKGDSAYKENLLKSLEQIVDVSQLAVSRILESNERNTMRMQDITHEGILQLTDIGKGSYDLLEKSAHNLEEFTYTTKSELNGIARSFNQLAEHMVRVHAEISKLQRETAEQQSRTNKLLEQITSICSELSYKEHLPEIPKPQDNLKPNISNKRIAKLFFVIDVSGSMAGDRITGLNSAMKRFISNFNNNHPIRHDAEVHLSVISYSTEAQWQYETPRNIDSYDWVDLEAGGLTNLGRAISLLNKQLNTYYIPGSIVPLIVFISDGLPTHSFEDQLATPTKRYCISIGHDAQNVFKFTSEFRNYDTSELDSTLDAIMNIYLSESQIVK